MSKNDTGVDVNVASSSVNINDENFGDDIAADNTVWRDDVVDARAGDGTIGAILLHTILLMEMIMHVRVIMLLLLLMLTLIATLTVMIVTLWMIFMATK